MKVDRGRIKFRRVSHFSKLKKCNLGGGMLIAERRKEPQTFSRTSCRQAIVYKGFLGFCCVYMCCVQLCMYLMVVLPFRGTMTARKMGRQESHAVQQREMPSSAPREE